MNPHILPLVKDSLGLHCLLWWPLGWDSTSATVTALEVYDMLFIVLPSFSPTVPRKSSTGGSSRKRPGSTKLPLSVPVLFPRVTRSSSRDKSSSQSSPPLPSPHPLTPPIRTSPTKSSPPTRSPSSARSPDTLASKKSLGIGPVSKEKQKRFGG